MNHQNTIKGIVNEAIGEKDDGGVTIPLAKG